VLRVHGWYVGLALVSACCVASSKTPPCTGAEARVLEHPLAPAASTLPEKFAVHWATPCEPELVGNAEPGWHLSLWEDRVVALADQPYRSAPVWLRAFAKHAGPVPPALSGLETEDGYLLGEDEGEYGGQLLFIKKDLSGAVELLTGLQVPHLVPVSASDAYAVIHVPRQRESRIYRLRREKERGWSASLVVAVEELVTLAFLNNANELLLGHAGGLDRLEANTLVPLIRDPNLVAPTNVLRLSGDAMLLGTNEDIVAVRACERGRYAYQAFAPTATTTTTSSPCITLSQSELTMPSCAR
jgi:hypothetical protein